MDGNGPGVLQELITGELKGSLMGVQSAANVAERKEIERKAIKFRYFFLLRAISLRDVGSHDPPQLLILVPFNNRLIPFLLSIC